VAYEAASEAHREYPRCGRCTDFVTVGDLCNQPINELIGNSWLKIAKMGSWRRGEERWREAFPGVLLLDPKLADIRLVPSSPFVPAQVRPV
jgi:hypothetical protein